MKSTCFDGAAQTMHRDNCVISPLFLIIDLTVAPTNLRPSKIGFTDVDLTWNQVVVDPAVSNVAGYRVRMTGCRKFDNHSLIIVK